MDFAGHGLVRAADVLPLIESYSSLTRAVERGELVKLRRGAYVDRETWNASDGRARHLLLARAVIADSSKPIVLAGLSAGAAWGVPVRGGFPDQVTVLEQWTGGGRSEADVRRTARGHATALVRDRDGFLVTSLARTVLDIARVTPFEEAVAATDWARNLKNPVRISGDELLAERGRVSVGYRRVDPVIDFSTDVSGSFGESICRGVMHKLGFIAPELQVRLTDDRGDMFPDFCWRDRMVLAEFDGKVKYTLDEYTHGNPSDVLWREKQREDRLRRMGFIVIRITWDDVIHPHRLERLLLDAGIPRGG